MGALAQLTYAPSSATSAGSFAQIHFYQPIGSLDPWNNLSTVAYDDHALLVTQTRDPVGNTVVVQNNYRVLGPWLTIDANLNYNGVRYDALGMITGTAAMGKIQTGGTYQGDYLDTSTPEASTTDDPTTTLDYNLFAYTTWVSSSNADPDQPHPIWGHTRARVRHQDPTTEWLETYTYTDGLGRVALTKAQAEPDPTLQRGPAASPTGTRWVGTGRVVYDNKGNPVKAYEPFFDTTYDYTDETELVQTGVTAITRYDPLSRAIRVDNPNGTYRTVDFDPWQTVTSDENDTVLDPAPNGSVWYAARSGGQLGQAEQAAATKAAAHAHTPTVTNLDTLGRVFQTVADNGVDASGNPLKYATTLTLDIQGRTLATQDALQRTVLTHDYDMTGAEIHHNSVDAGERWLLSDAGGQLLQAWDGRGYSVTAGYDGCRRPTTLEVTDPADTTRLSEQIIYGETLDTAQNPQAAATINLRGAAYQHRDEAGVATTAGRDFKNNIVTASRQLLTGYIDPVDWSTQPSLAGSDETFITTTTYDALNRVTSTAAPDGSITTPSYNQRSLLAAVTVNLQDGQTNVVTSVSYNAKAQRETTSYGNGASTTNTYDPDTFRLTNITTGRPANNGNDAAATQVFGAAGTVQNVTYTYDPAGNIVSANDAALLTIFYDNQRAVPANDYTYDPVYQLIQATGREHISQTTPQPTWDDAARTLLLPSDIQTMQPYIEIYAYDAVGNFQTITHSANTGSWTRTYAYDNGNTPPANNQLSATTIGSTTEQYTYDTGGNITAMPHLSLMQLDWKSQLQATAQQVVNGGNPETTYYTYDSSGQRVTKTTNGQRGTRTAQRTYLGAYEIYREYDTTASVTLERHSVHITDGAGHMCLLETTTVDSAATGGVPNTLARYEFGNNLGSTAIELDNAAALISYEEYYAYGATSMQTGTNQAEVSLKRYRYTGKERDNETGFSYHGARYYVPWLGVWASADPKQAVNRYAYVRNNPIKFFDPNGAEEVSTANRFWGAARMVGGAFQMLAGAAAFTQFETFGAAQAVGVVAIGHGLSDVEAGWRQWRSGNVEQSGIEKVVSGVAQGFKVGKPTADRIAAGVDAGLGFVSPVPMAGGPGSVTALAHGGTEVSTVLAAARTPQMVGAVGRSVNVLMNAAHSSSGGTGSDSGSPAGSQDSGNTPAGNTQPTNTNPNEHATTGSPDPNPSVTKVQLAPGPKVAAGDPTTANIQRFPYIWANSEGATFVRGERGSGDAARRAAARADREAAGVDLTGLDAAHIVDSIAAGDLKFDPGTAFNMISSSEQRSLGASLKEALNKAGVPVGGRFRIEFVGPWPDIEQFPPVTDDRFISPPNLTMQFSK